MIISAPQSGQTETKSDVGNLKTTIGRGITAIYRAAEEEKKGVAELKKPCHTLSLFGKRPVWSPRLNASCCDTPLDESDILP